MALIGPEANDYFAHTTSDEVFIGCTGAPANGLTTNSPFHVSLKKTMVNCSPKVIALIDSSKFLVTGTHVFCEYNRVSTIIMVETESTSNKIKELRKKGANIIIAW